MNNKASDWSGLAFNQVPHSSNRIHSDQTAKVYGFKGGLVPGVTLSAYLAHPAIEAWGRAWLEKGYIHVKVESPVYDGNKFVVEVEGDEQSYTADLISEGKRCAMAHVRLSRHLEFAPQPAKYSGHLIMEDDYCAPPATRSNMEKIQNEGCPAVRFLWSEQHDMTSYFREPEKMPTLLSTPKSGQGLANLSFLLGCANRHFAAVAAMSPWVHIETKSQNYEAVSIDTSIVSEMKIVDLFNKKGHEFADCEFNLFNEHTNQCVCSIWQRAIYKMRDLE